jgi:hypothetical protein
MTAFTIGSLIGCFRGLIGRVGPVRVFGDKFNNGAVGGKKEDTAPADWAKKVAVVGN